MPNLREYNQRTTSGGNFLTQVADPGVASAGSRSLVDIGEGVQSLGQAIDRRNQMNEMSNANVDMSAIQAKHTNILNAKVADGTFNSDEFLKDYQSDVEQVASKYSSSRTQNFIKENSANTAAHFAVTAASSATELAAVKFKDNIKQADNFYGNAVYNDPTSLDLAIKNYSLYIDNVSSGDKRTAKAAEAAKQDARANLAIQSVKGFARLNPDAAEHSLQQGAYDSYFDANKKEQMFAFINQVREGNEAKAKQNERNQEKAKKAAQDKFADDIFKDIHSGSFDPDKVVNAPPELMDWQTKRAMFAIVRTDGKEVKREKADSIVMETRKKIDSGEITESDALDTLVYERQISVADRDKLFKYLVSPLTTEGRAIKQAKVSFNKQAESLIAKGVNGIPQADGPKRMQELFDEVDKYVDEKRKGGKTLSELYNPANPESVYTLIQKHVPTLNDNIKGLTNRYNNGLTVGVKKEAPKMTPEEYLKSLQKENK